MTERIVGSVKMFNTDRGYGFIQRDNAQKDVFVHHSAVEEDSRPLTKGDRVEFSIEQGDKGPRAAAVKRLSK